MSIQQPTLKLLCIHFLREPTQAGHKALKLKHERKRGRRDNRLTVAQDALDDLPRNMARGL